MNKKTGVAIFLTLVLSACGGGSGGGVGTAPPAPAKAIVKLSTSGPGDARIGGVDVTLALPDGVTVKSASNPPETDAGAVVPSGQAAANSFVASVFTAGSPGTVHIALMNGNADGFGNGEFATITCELAPGATPVASDFTVLSSTVSDINGADISGVTVTVGVTLE